MKCSFRKWMLPTVLAVLLAGCGSRQTLETVHDEVIAVMAQPGKISVELPEDAQAAAMESETGRLFLGENYEIAIETLTGGNLDSTLRTMTGRGQEELTLVQTQPGDCVRYDFVWVSQSDSGEQLGRGVILDDGQYHYCLSVLRPENTEGDSQVVWGRVFQSFSVG